MTVMKFSRTFLLLASMSIFTGCTNTTTATTDATPQEVTLIAYDAFTPADHIFDAFTQATGTKVKVVTSGDTGTMVSKAILTAGKPEGDVMWGIDNTFLSRAQRAKVLESYEPADYGDICVNYDKKWFATEQINPPTSLEDLTKETYKGLLVTQDPVASSPGLGFLLATIAHFGDDNWQTYWKKLFANGVHIAPDWTTAYTVDFSGSSGKGSYPLVVSYGSSPPAEVLYSEKPISVPPTAVIGTTCFRQTEYVGVLRGTQNPNIARTLVNFLLDITFQESMPLSLFVFPTNKEAKIPKLFTDFAVSPTTSPTLEPSRVEDRRDEWLQSWRELALK
jgi:thiamine transport system substrate-binding protein